MKKSYIIMAAIASLALVSCSNEEFTGEFDARTGQGTPSEISFGMATKGTTRADLLGADAAAKLQNEFIIYGTKHVAAEDGTAATGKDDVVFTNYVVQYKNNTAGTTLSNTQNWEYVGKNPYPVSKVSPAVSSQSIKYWDYNAVNGYTFYGIASNSDISTGKVTVTKTTTGTTVYDKGYSVTLNADANLDNLFVADRKPVAKTDYGKPVLLTFRNFGARVRVGFYETVSGYSVKITKFYVDGDAQNAVTIFGAMDTEKSNFAASLQNINKSATSNTMAISYYNSDVDEIENHVKLTPSTVDYNYSLELGDGTGIIDQTLATSSASPTWVAGTSTDNYYTTVYPFEGNTSPMLVKVDFTLTSDDGSGEEIKVKGANVVVPTQYVQWKSNFAYTYIFKISNDTNGKIGEKEGLYPITFDAVVVAVADDKTQETITTFADYSITTYANGSKVTVNDEYKAGEVIYVVKTYNETNAVVAPSAIGTVAGNAQVYTATTNGDAISEATIKAKLLGAPNGITLTALTGNGAAALEQYVPAADGTQYDFGEKGAVKFTPSAAGTYVYVFTRTAYVAPTYASVGDAAWNSNTTYYFKTTSDVYYAASGINAGNFANYQANLYTKTADGTAGVYDVKVIKVQ